MTRSYSRLRKFVWIFWWLILVFNVGLLLGIGGRVSTTFRGMDSSPGDMVIVLLLAMAILTPFLRLLPVGPFFALAMVAAGGSLGATISWGRQIDTLPFLRNPRVANGLFTAQTKDGAAEMTVYYETSDGMGRWERMTSYEHPRFGTVLHPASINQAKMDGEFAVEYVIGDDGWRKINDPRPWVAFLGCSITFGAGVENDEVYTALLAQQWPQLRVSNRGYSGWGTAEAMIVLEETLKEKPLPLAVVYGYIGHHRVRNYLNASWHKILNPEGTFPLFELAGDGIVFKGRTKHKDAQQPPSAELTEHEGELTKRLIQRMDEMCRDRGVAFVFLNLNEKFPVAQPDSVVENVRTSGIVMVDASHASEDFYPKDGHPTPKWHAAVAHLLAQAPELSFLSQSK